MASDSRNVVIELRVTNSAGTPKEEEQNQTEEEQNTASVNWSSVLVTQAWGYAKSQITSMVLYDVNRYLNLTENYKTQMTVKNAQIAISKVTSLATMLATGFAVGNALGAAVAGVAWVISEGIGIAQRFNDAYTEIAKNNYQSIYAMSKLGLIDNGRGTQN